MSNRRRQRGAVLFVSLIMLVILTLFVVSSVNLSSADLRIVGNRQSKMAMSYSAQQAIEQVLSSIAGFNVPADQTITVNGNAVAVTAPQCLVATPAPGYSAIADITLNDLNWVLTATATDPITGATVSVTQGVRTRLPAGNCP